MPTVEVAGANVWWQATGDGPPLVLVQGLGYQSDAWWRLLPALSARFRVIVLDNRGVGRTGVPTGPSTGPLRIETMADDVAAVMSAAGEESAHVFGASLGGVVAQEFALRHPARVRCLILGCTGPAGPEAVVSDAAAQGFFQARANMTAREAAEASIPLVYADDTDRSRIAEDIEVRMKLPTTMEGYVAQLTAVMAYPGSYQRLGTITAPTLVIHGTADRLIPPANAELLAAAIPDARLAWLEGAGHVFTTDRTEETIELVLKFLGNGR